MKYAAVLVLSVFGSMVSSAYLLTPKASLDDVTFHGKVFDQKSHRPVNADVDIFCNSDFIKDCSVRTKYGEFTTSLKHYGWYIFTISAPGYLEQKDTLWVINETRRAINKNFYLVPIEVGLTVTLNNIYFDFGRTSLSSGSFEELDNVVRFFNENPGISFEIAGHTDRDGPEDYNLILSQGRAQAVVDYLVSHGVEASQLIARGYGETKPVDAGETRAAKSKNRRVELTVLNTGFGRANN